MKEYNDLVFDKKKHGDLAMLERAIAALYEHENDALALELLQRFGSLHGVFTATERELSTIPGMTRRAATMISVSMPALRQALLRADRAAPDAGSRLLRTFCSRTTRPPRKFARSRTSTAR